ncbi:EthD protein [Hartmannibacter diazotrophicus]|uniref:EthD protein n=1 Tax=Hartmannibacter diazotrophicus TaxID=1482074 RepID=A0A2C9DAJ6_9HYPH|nr:EthD family reductase [Hartmannibacter diazotrophicus]SON57352.1 EthD protein [Hartmannibacter diazotrophicus]
MSVSLQVIYPIKDGTTFNYDYYVETHLPLVGEHMGKYIQSTLVTKGVAGGPNVPPGIYAIATIVFADKQAMDAALGAAGPVLADIPNFTNSEPQMLIGDVIG